MSDQGQPRAPGTFDSVSLASMTRTWLRYQGAQHFEVRNRLLAQPWPARAAAHSCVSDTCPEIAILPLPLSNGALHELAPERVSPSRASRPLFARASTVDEIPALTSNLVTATR
jgi:hypothetical protein